MARELVDLTMRLHAETDKAILVSVSGGSFGTHAEWLSKSQIEFVPVAGKTQYVEVTIPEWLAIDKGLV